MKQNQVKVVFKCILWVFAKRTEFFSENQLHSCLNNELISKVLEEFFVLMSHFAVFEIQMFLRSWTLLKLLEQNFEKHTSLQICPISVFTALLYLSMLVFLIDHWYLSCCTVCTKWIPVQCCYSGYVFEKGEWSGKKTVHKNAWDWPQAWWQNSRFNVAELTEKSSGIDGSHVNVCLYVHMTLFYTRWSIFPVVKWTWNAIRWFVVLTQTLTKYLTPVCIRMLDLTISWKNFTLLYSTIHVKKQKVMQHRKHDFITKLTNNVYQDKAPWQWQEAPYVAELTAESSGTDGSHVNVCQNLICS